MSTQVNEHRETTKHAFNHISVETYDKPLLALFAQPYGIIKRKREEGEV